MLRGTIYGSESQCEQALGSDRTATSLCITDAAAAAAAHKCSSVQGQFRPRKELMGCLGEGWIWLHWNPYNKMWLENKKKLYYQAKDSNFNFVKTKVNLRRHPCRTSEEDQQNRCLSNNFAEQTAFKEVR